MAIDATRIFKPINLAILTISDTRTPDTDTSGDILASRVTDAGHKLIVRDIIKDDAKLLSNKYNGWVMDKRIDVIISTGGTGLTGRDVTIEALKNLKGSREIPGFGELFRWLSYKSIGTSTIQSRACAVVVDSTYIFALPGSNGAVKDGWDGILKEQLDSRNRPCNFVELIPRLSEK